MTKRVISIILAFVMLISIATITAFASALENESSTEKEFLYEDLIPEIGPGMDSYVYDEAYYHHVDKNDPESEIDWALVYCEDGYGPCSAIAGVVLDRVIVLPNMNFRYTLSWAIYDAELNEIISIDEADITKYDGFEKALEEAKVGNPFGDADYDSKLTIMDATYIQRAMACLCEFKEEDLIAATPWGVDYGRPLNYISDIDGDGERTVLDAIAIQKKLAQAE